MEIKYILKDPSGQWKVLDGEFDFQLVFQTLCSL